MRTSTFNRRVATRDNIEEIVLSRKKYNIRSKNKLDDIKKIVFLNDTKDTAFIIVMKLVEIRNEKGTYYFRYRRVGD